MKKVEVFGIIKDSFRLVFNKPAAFGLFFLPFIFVIPLLLLLVTGLLLNPILFLILIIFLIWVGVIGAGSLVIYVSGKERKFWKTLELGFKNSGRVLLAYLLEEIFIILGFLLLIIPGIFAAVRLSLVVPACILEKKGLGIKRSWDTTKGNFWRIFGILVIWNLVFFFLGFIPFLGILTIPLIPIYLTTLALLYIRLKRR